MSLSLDVSSVHNILVVRMAGELDHHTAEKVRGRSISNWPVVSIFIWS